MPRPIRIVLYFVLLLMAVVWLSARAAPPPAPDDPQRDVTADGMDATLASLRARMATETHTVVVLGDSSLGSHMTLAPDDTLAAMLERDARATGLALHVVAHEGFDPVAYYLLVDAITALRPDAVVLTANLQAFTDSWFRHIRMKHPQLAAFVRPARVPEAMALPLELAGVTDASLVVKPLLRLVGASELPEQLEGYRDRFRARLDGMLLVGARVASAGEAFAADVLVQVARGPRAGRPAVTSRAGGRLWTASAFKRTDLYPNRLTEQQATVRVLAATVRDLRARGTRAIAVIPPVHLEALRLTSAYQQRDIDGALRVVRDVVAANGGTPIDLSAELPHESFFEDAYTHFTAVGNRVVAERWVEELRRIIASDPPA